MNKPQKSARDCVMHLKKAPIPKLARGLLLLFISTLGLLGIRLFPSTFAEGWLPAVSLLVALGLITAALIEVMRAR